MRHADIVEIFDGHSDTVQRLVEYRRGGRDFPCPL